MRPIFLVGFMGSGKTTVGKHLAQKLGLTFCDLDQFIEEKQEKSIPEIFAEAGEDAFRIAERNALKEVAIRTDCVISTGGGTPCFFDNMALMNASGTTIYLNTSIKELVHRLHYKGNKRPLLQGKDENQLHDYIAQALLKREAFYNQAQIKILADDTNATINRLTMIL